MTKKNIRVLFIYPNQALLNPPPVSMGILTALLKSHNIEVEIFDTTFYKTGKSSDKAKEEILQVRPFKYDENMLPIRTGPPGEDLCKLVENYKPDLIALSVLEATWKTGKELLDAIKGVDVPVIVGGVFATFGSEIVLKHPTVSMICRGEGEGTLLELCQRLREGKDYSDIRNLWVKKGNNIIRNRIREVIDINKLPIPDYSPFHKARFLRPMAGRIYRTVPIETNRGCPYSCTFCNSPSTAKLYKDAGAGNFFRKKSLKCIQEELRDLIKKWDAEYCYFLSDSFLVMSKKEFDQFIEVYSEFKLPFWIQSRAEMITKYHAEKLKEVGCHRISIGLEHGNQEFRNNILKKNFQNNQIIKASKILYDVGIPLTVNNIIGFPDETRTLIFDTIELNRKLKFDTCNAYAFTPFHGTPLHEYCVEKGYRAKDDIVGLTTIDTPLEMPQLTKKEIEGLRRTFALYAKLPKKYWQKIKRAEEKDEEGMRIYNDIRKKYTERYF